jgi:hypothetical protein
MVGVAMGPVVEDSTVMLAEAVLPGPASFDVTLVVTLFFNPTVVPVTFTAKVQNAPAAKLAPNRLTLADPAVAVMPPPPQDPVTPLGVATIRPAGKVSVKPTPLSDTLTLGLVIVKLRLVIPFSRMVGAPNALLIMAGTSVEDSTVRLAEAVLPGPASFDVTLLVTLFFIPRVVPLTFTEKVQEALDAKLAPNRLTLDDPAVAVMLPPPQDPVRPLGVATTSPAGKASVKPTPLSDGPTLGLARVKLRLVAAFRRMLGAPNALLIVGGDKPKPELQTVTLLLSSVTAPFRAKTLPLTLALVFRVMLVSATTLPGSEAPVPRVAELPTCQDTPQLEALLMSMTDEPLAVVSVLPILKMKTAFEWPCASRVSIPVNWAEDAKQ